MELKTILGLAVAAAIPVVMLAIWCEYFRSDVSKEDAEENPDEPVIRDRELRIRLAGLMATALQLIIFLATSQIREEGGILAVASVVFTLGALLTQRLLQGRLEREISPQSANSAPIQSSGGSFLHHLAWAMAGLAAYLGILIGCVVASTVIVALFKLQGPAALGVVGAGTIVGYSLALASNFVLSPMIFRRLLPSDAIEDSRVLALLERWFAQAQTSAPEFRVIRSDSMKARNAWVTGFSGLGGELRPVLWMTPTLFEDFRDPDLHGQLEAIVKHEAAHMRLGHLRKRFALAWAMSMSVLMTLAVSLALNAFFKGQQVASVLPLFSLVAAFALMWTAFRLIQKQAHRHEIEADRHCVESFHARASDLAAALRRIESWNLSEGRSVGGEIPNLMASHPGTNERIAALRPLLEQEKPEDSHENRAA